MWCPVIYCVPRFGRLTTDDGISISILLHVVEAVVAGGIGLSTRNGEQCRLLPQLYDLHRVHSGTDPIVHFLSDVTDDAKADTC